MTKSENQMRKAKGQKHPPQKHAYNKNWLFCYFIYSLISMSWQNMKKICLIRFLKVYNEYESGYLSKYICKCWSND